MIGEDQDAALCDPIDDRGATGLPFVLLAVGSLAIAEPALISVSPPRIVAPA
jgi:hypothetical protein